MPHPLHSSLENVAASSSIRREMRQTPRIIKRSASVGRKSIRSRNLSPREQNIRLRRYDRKMVNILTVYFILNILLNNVHFFTTLLTYGRKKYLQKNIEMYFELFHNIAKVSKLMRVVCISCNL